MRNELGFVLTSQSWLCAPRWIQAPILGTRSGLLSSIPACTRSFVFLPMPFILRDCANQHIAERRNSSADRLDWLTRRCAAHIPFGKSVSFKFLITLHSSLALFLWLSVTLDKPLLNCRLRVLGKECVRVRFTTIPPSLALCILFPAPRSFFASLLGQTETTLYLVEDSGRGWLMQGGFG